MEEFHIDINNVTKKYTEEAVDYIRRKADQPFFLFLAHSMMHVPIYVSDEFAGKSGAGIYGDAVLEVDWSVGRIMETLRELGLDDNTLVVLPVITVRGYRKGHWEAGLCLCVKVRPLPLKVEYVCLASLIGKGRLSRW